MKIIYSVFLLFILMVSCTRENDKVPIANTLKVFEAKGIVMNSDTIKPAIIISAGMPKIIKALKPKVISLKPSQGEAGGISIMQNYTTDNGLALDAVSFGHKSAICDKIGNLWFATNGGGVSRYDGKSFTNFTTAQGLASNDVRSIIEDKLGNLWFATVGGGVSRYDGKSFTNFTTTQGLANNVVLSITEDKIGNLWFGTIGGGVSCYNGNRVDAIERGDREAQQTQQDLKKVNGKLVKSFINYTTTQGLVSNDVRSIAVDKTGNIWFGTVGGGISRYDGKSFTNFTIEQGLASNDVRCITEDKTGNLWFGTVGGGVSRYNGKTFTNFTIVQGLADNVVLSITEDKTGNLWFGTEGKGVSRYNGKFFTNFTTAQGLANNVVLSITEDKTGNLWFGTEGGGLSRYGGKSFTNFTTAQGLVNNVVLSIAEDKTGNLWFGTNGGGVSRYNGKCFTNFTTEQGLVNNVILSIAEDKNGNIWFGTNGGGVSRYNGEFFSNFTTEQGLADNVVLSIIEDKTGNLWFGTNGGGVSRYDGQSFTNFTTEQGLANNVVRSIIEDKTGNLWFATAEGGISHFNGKFFTNYTTTQGLANNVVYSIAEDKIGNIWLGTAGGGVSRFDGNCVDDIINGTNLYQHNQQDLKKNKKDLVKSFINFTTAQGLPDNTITQIIITKEENIAIASNFGVGVLVSFTSQSATENTKNNISSVNNLSNQDLKSYEPVIEIYNSATGYPVKDVNVGDHCMFLDNKGIIWMATGADKTALVRFDYTALNKNPNPPLVIIQSIKINDENICWYNLGVNKNDSVTKAQQEVITFGKSLTAQERKSVNSRFGEIQFDGITKFYPLPKDLVLPYKNNHIGFEFAAIEPARPYLIKYQYFLEGYDKEWSPLTNKTDVSFGNMYEGTYTFMLKAMSPEGIWSEPITYSFKVLPPWYRTWWMYTVYFLALISFIWLMIWYNGRKLNAKAIELKQKVDEATFEIKEQKYVIEGKHKEITDSINYAERIQRSFLATKELLDDNLNSTLSSKSGGADYFVFFQPKDVVSGDFYWAHHSPSLFGRAGEGLFYLVTADSTGHGVPGAIMSLLNITSLEKAIEDNLEPAAILNATRKTIIERLKKDGSPEGGKDGMDCSLICFDFKNYKMTYAAANNPVWIIRGAHPNPPEGRENQRSSQLSDVGSSSPLGRLGGAELLEFKPDKMPVGKHDKDNVPFTQHTIDLQKGDIIYTLTDGFPDQFGGDKGKKFMIKNLKELLIKIAHLSMNEQKQILNKEFNIWKGKNEQVDDVCIIGVRV